MFATRFVPVLGCSVSPGPCLDWLESPSTALRRNQGEIQTQVVKDDHYGENRISGCEGKKYRVGSSLQHRFRLCLFLLECDCKNHSVGFEWSFSDSYDTSQYISQHVDAFRANALNRYTGLLVQSA